MPPSIAVWAITPFSLSQVKPDYEHLRETLLRVTKERDLAARGKHQLQAKLENLEQVLKVSINPEFHQNSASPALPLLLHRSWCPPRECIAHLSAPLRSDQRCGVGTAGADRGLTQPRDSQRPLPVTPSAMHIALCRYCSENERERTGTSTKCPEILLWGVQGTGPVPPCRDTHGLG